MRQLPPCLRSACGAGLSLVPVRSAGALVAFGGYNGKYHNSAQVFRPGEDALARCTCLHDSASFNGGLSLLDRACFYRS